MERGFIEEFFLRGFIENFDKTYYELCVLYDTPTTVELLLLRALVKATDERTVRLDGCEKRVDT